MPTPPTPPEQLFMGAVFAGMGLATMLFPATVSRLSFPRNFLALQQPSSTQSAQTAVKTKQPLQPERSPPPPPPPPSLSAPFVLAIRCFGAQASLCGLLILAAPPFSRRTYAAFGLAMAPFFAFDAWAWAAGALTPLGALGDAAGNAVFAACCWIGFRRYGNN
ncbi:hypothetical protein DFJ73DRAFT_758164 [Zopfochytrium polystomum]|nr:hypothetical protein DFJ73DRAFT_758164 [Zopfochytrium polystomum]